MLRWRAAHGWGVLSAAEGLTLRRNGVDTFVRLPTDIAREVADGVTSLADGGQLSPRAQAIVAKLDERSVLAVEVADVREVLARHEPGDRASRTLPASRWSATARAVPAAHIRFGPNGLELGGSATGDRVFLTSAWAAERATRLIAREPVAAEDRLEAEFLQLVARAGLLVDDEGDAPVDGWAFHDKVFHAATRFDTSSGLYGAKLDAGPAPASAALPRPSGSDRVRLGEVGGGSRGLRLHEAFALRRSIRDHGGDPIGLAELGAVLGGSIGVRRLADTSSGELAWRPIPNGGARSGLSAVVVAGRTRDLAPGAYEYDAVSHELAPASGPAPAIQRWFSLVQRLTGIEADTVQMLLLVTLDYSRPAHGYNSIVYSTALKELGATLQSMALLSVDLDLAFCPLGGGFATTEGLGDGIRRAAVIGEAVLGRPGRRRDGAS